MGEFIEGAITVCLCAYDPGKGDICGGEEVTGEANLELAGRNGIQGSSEHFGFRKKQRQFFHGNRRKDR